MSARMLARVFSFTLLGALAAVSPATPAASHHMGTECIERKPSAWLTILNDIRTSSGSPPVVEDPALSEGAFKHARYIVKTDELAHSENPNSPWFTTQGEEASRMSVLAGFNSACATDWTAVGNALMQAPFHSAHMLNPRLSRTGYGSYREADGGIEMGAALNVGSGLGELPPGQSFPILWPGPGRVVWLNHHWGEWPSPLTSCPGYQAPTGLPLVAQFASTPNVTSTSFSAEGTELEHCAFDGATYENPIQAEEDLARSILSATNSVVLIPRLPLTSETTYHASLTVNGAETTWSFTVDISNVLSVTRNGRGKVWGSSSGFSCPRRCSQHLPSGSMESLRADPARGWRFVRWSQDCGGQTCSVHMTEDRDVAALFRRIGRKH